ncbi:MAG: hypothetical protein PVI30_05950 [Myxococcales bacterium]|jgi:hypothetical protein
MARGDGNRPWNLERFLDALILELDKAQDTLAVKSLNRKLTYTVRDVALDLHIFPSYDGDEVRFVTASPGDEGASRISMQLGSITDRQIRDNTREPVSRDEVSIEEVEGIDEPTRKSLESMGVRSVDDLERMERFNVKVESELQRKGGKKAVSNYKRLATMIQQSRRTRNPPRVGRVSLSLGHDGGQELRVTGDNLVLSAEHPALPLAELDGERLDVTESGPRELRLRLNGKRLSRGHAYPLRVALDPHTLIQLKVEV